MKRILAFLLVPLLSLSAFACGTPGIEIEQDNYAAIVERGYVVVGLECQYAPFNWTVNAADRAETAVLIDGTDAYCDGYDVVVAQAVATHLGVDLVVKAIDWDGLIPSLAVNGRIDLIIAGMSPTPERAETVAFSAEYYRSTHVVVVRADSAFADATSILGFTGAKVVGQLGTIYDDLIPQMTGALHENPLSDVPTIVTSIKSGINDATVLERPVAVAIIAGNPELAFIDFLPGSGFVVDDADAAVAIAVRQADVTLLAAVNAALAAISAETREGWMLSAIDRQP